MSRYPVDSAALTDSAVSAGGVWKTPKPRAGIVTPLLRVKSVLDDMVLLHLGIFAAEVRQTSGLGIVSVGRPPACWSDQAWVAGRSRISLIARCMMPALFTRTSTLP